MQTGCVGRTAEWKASPSHPTGNGLWASCQHRSRIQRPRVCAIRPVLRASPSATSQQEQPVSTSTFSTTLRSRITAKYSYFPARASWPLNGMGCSSSRLQRLRSSSSTKSTSLARPTFPRWCSGSYPVQLQPLAQATVADILSAGIVPVSKTVAVDLLALRYPHDKPEGRPRPGGMLFGVNDDDFAIVSVGAGIGQKCCLRQTIRTRSNSGRSVAGK